MVFPGKAVARSPPIPKKAKRANPITWISNKTPPFLLMNGDADNVVSPSQSTLLHEALVAKKYRPPIAW